ncbi:unnamed protein product [Strongylus vulgaris]|uniref:Uncharacterized protein n=1 Tax=Strongylus vulgaris TaxID=40348 RepID=A0A3P7IV35_STRVU|nr:unnamed protein product [Strongylus vulgaris]
MILKYFTLLLVAAGVEQLVASLKHGGITAMLKDGIFADELAVAAMLRMFNEKKRWDINICNAYLEKLKGTAVCNRMLNYI